MNKIRRECSALTSLQITKTSAEVSAVLKAERRFNRKHGPLSYTKVDNSPCKLAYDDDNNDWGVPIPILNREKFTINLNSSHRDITVLAGIEEDSIQLNLSPHRIEHPEFSEDIQLDTPEALSEFWGGQEQDSEESRYWSASVVKHERDRLKLENRVHQHCDDPELLLWAGIINREEAQELECARPDLDVLHTLMNDEEFPEMELMFFEGRLCINEIPTIIREEDLRDLYNGYTAFNGSEDAKKVVISTIKKLLMQLFRKE